MRLASQGKTLTKWLASNVETVPMLNRKEKAYLPKSVKFAPMEQTEIFPLVSGLAAAKQITHASIVTEVAHCVWMQELTVLMTT